MAIDIFGGDNNYAVEGMGGNSAVERFTLVSRELLRIV